MMCVTAPPGRPTQGVPLPRLQRVLYAIALDPRHKFGSLEEQICVLGGAFEERGSLFLPLFFCEAEPDKTCRFEQAGLHAACLDLKRFRWSTLWRLWRLVRRERIEVIHWNFSEPLANSYLWLLTVLAPRLKHYYTDHNSRSWPIRTGPGGVKRWVKRLLLRRYTKVLCVSRFVHDCLEEQRTWKHLQSCLHFVNAQRFKPDAEARQAVRTQLDAGERFVLVVVANLIKDKGIDVALEALTQLPASVVLWVIGEGPEEGPLRQTCNRLQLDSRVRFLGLQSNVAPYLQAADCLLCPSRWAEAAGLVNLEAHAAGLPVIASRIGGIPEYVEDGQTGYLFDVGDAKALANHVESLRNDAGRYQAMSAQARTRVLQQFSVESRLNEYLDLYRCP